MTVQTDTTTAAPAAPAAPAPTATLLPDAAAVVAPAAPDAAPAAPAAAPVPPGTTPPVTEGLPPNTQAPANTQWFWAPNVPGPGEKPPEWFKAAKYTSVEEQAKAYVELEKRFGSFTGAPAEGKYEFAVPAELKDSIEIDPTHPVFEKFKCLAKDMQLSQDGFNKIMGTLVEYEASMVPTVEETRAAIGADADTRITSVAQWAKANLGTDGYNDLRSVITGQNAAATFKLVEGIIAKTRQVAVPKTDPGAAATFVDAKAEIDKLQGQKDAKGNMLYFTDPAHRALVEQKRVEYFKSLEAK